VAQELRELPDGWEYTCLGSIAQLIGGATPSKKVKTYWGGDIKWASVRDLKVDNLARTEYSITDDGLASCSSNIIPKGNLIIATRVGLGKVSYTKVDVAINQDLRGVIPSSNVSVEYLFFWFKQNAAFIESCGTGATVKGVKIDFIKALIIPLPPLNEQKCIVAKLDALFTRIDAGITHLQQTLELSKALFASALDEVFSPEKNKTELVSLNQIATVARGKSKHRPRNDKNLFDGDYPFIQTGDVRNAEKYITEHSTTYNEKGLAQSKLWPEGTVCLTIAANIGEVAILGIDACFPDSVVGISSDSESNEYIYYFLSTLQRHLDSKATMAAQKNINLRVLSDIEIPLPPLDEQKRIVAHLDTLSERTQTLEVSTQEKINDLTAFKASLLDSAFKGEL